MRDNEAPDPLIEEVAAELRKPVALRSDLEERIRAEIRQHPAQSGRPGRWWPAVVAVAAGLSAVALLLLPKGRPQAEGVEFVIDAPRASRVTLVGDFNNWDPGATPLVQVATTGKWRAVLPLPPGRYEYTFLIDGSRWVLDPGVPQSTGDDYGLPSSVITVVKAARS